MKRSVLIATSICALCAASTTAQAQGPAQPPPPPPPAGGYSPAPAAEPQVPAVQPQAVQPPPSYPAAPAVGGQQPPPPSHAPAVPGIGQPPAPPEAPKAVADGFVIQSRMETGLSLTGAALATPGFIIGGRTGSLTLGVGLGLSKGAVDVKETTGNNPTDTKYDLTAFQIVPTLLYDLWQSSDGKTRFNLLGAIGYARGAVSSQVSDNTSTRKDEYSASLIPIRLGLGGDHFLHPNFGIGAEFGIQSLILAGVSNSSSEPTQPLPDISFNYNAAYGAMRMTLVVGQ
jgi:hypothetical protein